MRFLAQQASFQEFLTERAGRTGLILDNNTDQKSATPDQFNMRRGYTPSWSGTPLSVAFGRPPELTRYRAALGGLYLCGAGTFPGAGIWGSSGRNAASVVLTGLSANGA